MNILTLRTNVVAGFFAIFAAMGFSPTTAEATTYYSDTGATRTWNINVSPGTHTFIVNGITAYRNTEWYVNGTYIRTDVSQLSNGYWDPTYDRSFSSGSTTIRAIVYNSSWTVLETHTWNVTVPSYTVTLDKQSGSGGSSSVTATYGAAMPSATAPTRSGYTFQGYYDGTGGSGNKYYNANMSSARNWDKTANATLYAYWTANTYTVTFDKQSGSGGSSSVTATYGSAMPSASAPSRTGYTFQGYYDGTGGSGNKYYNANMSSARNWDKTVNSTLYAYWTIISYNVSASAGTGGTVSPSSRSVSYNNTTTFTVTPATYYTRNSVSGDASGGSWSGNTYTTAPVTQNRSLSFSFTPWPDLIVTTLWTEPANPAPGQNYVIKAVVRNQGAAVADPPLLDAIEMAFWVDGVYKGGEQLSDLCYTIAANGGEFTFTSVTLTAPAAGTHTVLAKADWNDSLASDVDEINESNNERSITMNVIAPVHTVSASAGTGGSVSPSSRTVTNGNTTTFTVSSSTYYTRNSVSGDASGGSWSGNTYTTAPVTQNRSLSFSFTPWPDLIVTTLWTEPANPAPGQNYVIKAIVRNQGAAIADPPLLDAIEMAFWVDGVYKGGEQLSDLCYTIAANGGEFTFTSVTLTAPAAGSHTVLAKADWNDSLASDVDEINEGNNERSITMTVIPPVYTVTASAGTGGTVSPSSRSVTNGNTTTFTVSPATYYTRNSVSGDASGGSWSGNTYTTAPVTQDRSLSFSFTAWPDLIVTNVWTVPTNPIEGQSYVIKAIVRNQGAAIADPPLLDAIEMAFWVDGVYKGGEQLSDLCYSIAANGGEFTFTSITLTAPAVGSHTILAKADWNDSLASDVDEINEDNNTRSGSFTSSSITGAKITSFVPLTGLVAYGSTGTVTVVMQNTGTTTRAFWIGLSFSGPSSGTWPDGWYDVPPQQTANLAPNDTQTIQFSFEIPYSLTPGQYIAHTAIWDSYDSVTDLMVEPRYDYKTNSSFVVSGNYIPGYADDPYGLIPLDVGGLYNSVPKGNRGSLQDLEAHIANPLLNAKTGAALTSSNDRVVVVVHGWNPWETPEPLRSGDWDTITSQLRGSKLNAEWSLVEYDWHNDAATGFIIFRETSAKATTQLERKPPESQPQPNSVIGAAVKLALISAQMAAEYDAIQAAERAYAHGIVLGQRIVSQIGPHNLKQIQLIGHSAGSWAVYSALRYISAHAPNCEVQVAFLDPFIPDQTSYNLLPLLNHAFKGQVLEQSVGYTRISTPGAAKAEAYYTFTDETELSGIVGWPSQATSVSWSWSGVSLAYVRELFTLDPIDWKGHSGPVNFFGDSISTPAASRIGGFGWNKSLAFNTAVTRIIRLGGDLSFGVVPVGGSSQRTLTIYNDGNDPLVVSSVSLPTGFSGNWSGIIGVGGSQSVTITFNPLVPQIYSGNVVVSSDATSGANTRAISGTGLPPPTIAVTPSSQSFGSILVGTTADRTFTVQNVGGETLTGSASVSAPFSIVSNGSYSLGAGASQVVTVRYSPSAEGTHNQNVAFTGGGGATRAVNGSAYNTISLTVTPANHSFGWILVGGTADRTFTVQNTGGGTLSGSASAVPPFSIISGGTYSLGAGASQIITVRYSPLDAGTHSDNLTFSGGEGTTRPVSGNALSASEHGKLGEAQMLNGTNLILRWRSLTGYKYAVHSSTSLIHGFTAQTTNILATPPENIYTNTMNGEQQKFLRVTEE